MYGFARDITERKLAEEALKNTLEELQQRNQELDHYVYKVSHDLRSPLCSIKGLLNLAEYETDAAAILVYNRMIGEQINRSDEFIQSILNHSKMLNSADNREAIDFEAVLRQGFEDMQYVKGYARLQRRVRLDQQVPFYGDPFRISLILRNFISNAIKYQNPEAETSYVQFAIAVDAHQARITITDNGIGVEEGFVPHLFDMFFRATEKAEGSGLGLYIVKQAIQRIGGFIAVTSQFGAGTEFVITLPNGSPAGVAETTR
jgi:signal transduction histidine kinase